MIHPPIYRIRLSAVELRQLLNAYRLYVLPLVEPKEYFERLNWQIMLELCQLFHRQAKKLQSRNNIKLAGSQAMAFMAFWSQLEVIHNYEDLVIRNIIASLDQSQKSYAATSHLLA